MFKAIEVTNEQNLEQFSRLLWQRKISHRIHSLEHGQIVAVSKPEDVPNTKELFRAWLSGEVQPLAEDFAGLGAYFSLSELISKGFIAFTQAPLSLTLMLVCVVLGLIAPLNSNSSIMLALLYPDFSMGTSTLNLPLIIEQFSVSDFFKMISPMLLHGGFIHLAFNMIWLWEFGRRIEAKQSSWGFLLLIIVISLISNTGQYLFGSDVYNGFVRFGGMSGVVYGLFAYIWMWKMFDPAKGIDLPLPLIIFMLVSLAIMTYIGFDSIADAAHIGGLLCGVVYGAVVATISRIKRGQIRAI